MKTRKPMKITRKLTDNTDDFARHRDYDVFLDGEPVGTVAEYTTLISGHGSRIAHIPSRTELVRLDWAKLARLTGISEDALRREMQVMYMPTGPRLTEALQAAARRGRLHGKGGE